MGDRIVLYRQILRLSVPMLGFVAGAACAPALAQTGPGDPQPPIRYAQSVIVAPAAPPPLRTETIPPPPTVAGQPTYWQPGHWSWTPSGWVWIAGAYVMPPQPTAAWVPGQWVTQPGGGYVWVDGHWQG
jgi:hypothetical protein